MKSFSAIALGLLASCSVALADGEGAIGLTPVNPKNHSNQTKEYTITFMRNQEHNKTVEDYLNMLKLEGDVVKYESGNDYTKVYVWDICDEHAAMLNGLAEVDSVETKVMAKSFVQQKQGSPWGLQRISSQNTVQGSPANQNYVYSYNDQSLGGGVDLYIVDTGVRTSHQVFTGRAKQGFSATGSFVDGDGHGTHVAGTAAGAKFGVAQGANIIEVKVLGDDGSGSSTDTIKGMDWVIQQHQIRRTQPGFVGSIMSMSWGLQGTINAVDQVIAGAQQAGIHVAVAAGNDGVDACGDSPAHLGGQNSNVVTVGSVNIQNTVSSFSNVGNCVDIFAPGENVISSWSTGDNVINTLSGTSMATPHTSGVMAYLMATDPKGLGQNPAALKAKLLSLARQGQVTGNVVGSPNRLLSNGVNGATTKRLFKNYVVPDANGSPAARAAAAINARSDLEGFELHSRETTLRF